MYFVQTSNLACTSPIIRYASFPIHPRLWVLSKVPQNYLTIWIFRGGCHNHRNLKWSQMPICVQVPWFSIWNRKSRHQNSSHWCPWYRTSPIKTSLLPSRIRSIFVARILLRFSPSFLPNQSLTIYWTKLSCWSDEGCLNIAPKMSPISRTAH